MGKNARFEVIAEEGTTIKRGGKRQIYRDKETGVNYLYVEVGYSGGLTPLLDADGKPIVTKS